MGAGSSAASGPGGYSLDQLLEHWSGKGELTAAKAAECTGAHLELPLSVDELAHAGCFSNAILSPDDVVTLDLDKFRDCARSGAETAAS